MNITFPLITYNTEGDIQSALANVALSQKVEEIEKSHHNINISKTMADLVEVGSLLQLSYASSIGFRTHVVVMDILMSYQKLIGDSGITCTGFLTTSLFALRNHITALKFADRSNYEAAMRPIVRCQDLALRMAEISNTLVDSSRAIHEKSKEASITAIEESNMELARKNELKRNFNELAAKQAALEVTTKALAAEVAAETTREAAAAKNAQAEEKKAFFISLISTVMRPLAEPLGAFADILRNLGAGDDKALTKAISDSETIRARTSDELIKLKKDIVVKKVELAEKEKIDGVDSPDKINLKKEIAVLEVSIENKSRDLDRINSGLDELAKRSQRVAENFQDEERRRSITRGRLQEQQRAANADLASSLVALQNMKSEENNLEMAIKSLEITQKTLGKIVTAFENVRLFWTEVGKRCESLTTIINLIDLESLADGDMKEDFIDAIKSSGLQWFALGKTNLFAKRAMLEAKMNIDRVMCDLPGREVVFKLIPTLTQKLLEGLNESVSSASSASSSSTGSSSSSASSSSTADN